MKDDDAFHEVLALLEGTGFEFDGYLSNHGPMACDALIALGAGDTAPRWADQYRHKLGTAPRPRFRIEADAGDWRRHLGEYGRVADWTALFQRALATAPWTDVLAVWWPRLVPGMSAAATHGVIRTAHAVRAVERGDGGADDALLDELARGLGYWAARYQELPGRVTLRGPKSASRALSALPRLNPALTSEEPGIMARVAMLDQLPGFPEALEEFGAPGGVPETLTAITRAAARAFVECPGPAVPLVHSLTAPAAVRMVLPHLPTALHLPTVAAAWHTSTALIAAFAAPARTAAPRPAPDAAELTARAVEHGDEHAIKMTEACLREYHEHADPFYLRAADNALRSIATRT